MRFGRLLMFLLLLSVSVACSAQKTSGSDLLEVAENQKPIIEEKVGEAAAAKASRPSPAAATRLELLKEEWSHYEDTLITHSAASLSNDEKDMLRHLEKAAQFLGELYMLQVHPDNLKWRDQVMTAGQDIEKKVFERYQRPWCFDIKDPQCKALEQASAPQVGYNQWPIDFTADEVEKLGREINTRELLSPFTVVRSNSRGSYDAIPYGSFEPYKPKMAIIAAELRAAAEYAPHKSLNKFLKSRADAFESADPFPYDKSDYRWISTRGDWDVTIGPYEVYQDPFHKKAMFQMYVGRIDKGMADELGRLGKHLQEMEDRLAALLGPVYKSRKLDKRIAMRAIDVWIAAGEGRMGAGAIAAFHLPNRGPSVDDGLYKKVIMTNHGAAFENIVVQRGELTLAPEFRPFIDGRSSVTNVTFHELAHGFGAHGEMVIKDHQGRTTTVNGSLREHGPLMEELKANNVGLWLVDFQKANGWLDSEQVKKRYVSGVMHTMGLLQYPLKGTYPRMAAIEIGWHLQNLALVWDEATGFLRIDVKKLPASIESLVKKVAIIQLRGHKERADQLVSQFIKTSDDGTVELVGPIAAVRSTCIERYKKAGLKSPSLRYEITDL